MKKYYVHKGISLKYFNKYMIFALNVYNLALYANTELGKEIGINSDANLTYKVAQAYASDIEAEVKRVHIAPSIHVHGHQLGR